MVITEVAMSKKEISDLIYNELNYMYCDNCRFDSEISEEESIKLHGVWRCDCCYRKYNGWGVSRAQSDAIAEIICKKMNENMARNQRESDRQKLIQTLSSHTIDM